MSNDIVQTHMPTRKNFKNLTGLRFGRLTIESFSGIRFIGKRIRTGRLKRNQASFWNCICDCGKRCVVSTGNLRSGGTKSCGCFSSYVLHKRNTNHGHSSSLGNSPEFNAWCTLKSRCLCPTNQAYNRYGGIGITVAECWIHNFQSFFDHIGPRPSPEYSVDRIDNSRGYEPGNVRWATSTEQNRNTRRNRMMTYKGKTQCMAAWAEELGIRYNVLNNRTYAGWSDERSLSTPCKPLIPLRSRCRKTE